MSTQTTPEMSARDQRRNALAGKIGNVVHGENLIDVAIVCARMISFAIAQSPQTPGEKKRTLLRLIKAMRHDLKALLQRTTN